MEWRRGKKLLKLIFFQQSCQFNFYLQRLGKRAAAYWLQYNSLILEYSDSQPNNVCSGKVVLAVCKWFGGFFFWFCCFVLFFLNLVFSWHPYNWGGFSISSMAMTRLVKQSSVSRAERSWTAGRWVEITGMNEPSAKRNHSRKAGMSCKVSMHFGGWDLTKNNLSLGKVIKHSDNYFTLTLW